jgi:hypothetical protein
VDFGHIPAPIGGVCGSPSFSLECFVIKPLAVAAFAGLLLAACSQGGDPGDDRYGGLDPEILAWRGEIEAAHSACAAKVEGKGCESFQVTCKAAQEISADEAAKGVTAQIVAAMSFNGRSADGSSGKPGSSFARFSKIGGHWTRVEAPPVNMSSCAPV